MGKHGEKFLLLGEARAEHPAAAEPNLAASSSSKCIFNFALLEPPCDPSLSSPTEYPHTQLPCPVLGWAQLCNPAAFLFDVCVCFCLLH